MRSILLAAFMVGQTLVSAALSGVPWHRSLYLANGGYWPVRLPIVVTNAAAEDVAGDALSVSLPQLAGARVEAIRVCRADGVELLYELRDAQGRTKRAGALDGADRLIFPIECPGHAATTVFIYAGNSQAWAVPDFLPSKYAERPAAQGNTGLLIAVGDIERLQLKSAALIKQKAGPNWRDWAEVRVRFFGEQAVSNKLIRVNLRKALGRLPGGTLAGVAAWDGRELKSFCLGKAQDLLFSTPLDPLSEEVFQVGLSSGRPHQAEGTLEDYGRLLTNRANLVPNGSFEESSTTDLWRKPVEAGANQVASGFSSDARFGARSLELKVGENARAAWVGWNSREIPVQPGATYFLSGWLKAAGLAGAATIHAHFHDAGGALTKSGAMVSTQPAVSGNSDWVNSSGFFQAPPDAASIQLHLTMNTQGMLRHDGIVLCEVIDGEVGTVHTSALGADRGLQVWEVNPLVKVFPDTPPQRQSRGLSVELAGNEYEPIQLAFRSPDITNRVSISISTLQGPDGVALPPVKIERVGFVPVDYPSAYYTTDVAEWCRRVPRGAGSTDGWAGWWPDPLAPCGSLDIPAGQTQPVWLTVHAPKSARPGIYQAPVTLSGEAGTVVKLPLKVRVLPFTLPDRGRLRAIFDFRFGPGGGFGSGADSVEDKRKWLRFMSEHRLGVDHIEPAPKFAFKDGQVTMDATAFDEAAAFCFDELHMNVAYTPQFFYMFGWAYPPKKLFGLEPFTPEWTSAFRQAYKLFTDHVRAKGWHDHFVYYISDEPHFQHDFVVEQMKKLCALIHEVDPAIPIYSSTWRHCAAWDNSLDIWGIGQYGCFPVGEMEQLQRAGKQMWFTCDGQMATDTPYLATERLLPYYCFKYGVRGFEFWGLAWWTYNPWQVGWHQFIRQSDEGQKYYWIRYPDGDGFLAYPGKPVGVDGPVSTIRLEQIRQGLEDYEALTLLVDLVKSKPADSASAAQRALDMARDLVSIPNAGGLRSTEILPDPQRVAVVRKAVNAALVQLLSEKH